MIWVIKRRSKEFHQTLKIGYDTQQANMSINNNIYIKERS